MARRKYSGDLIHRILQFRRDADDYEKKEITRANKQLRKIGKYILRKAIDMSPVDYGDFKASWTVTLFDVATTPRRWSNAYSQGAKRIEAFDLRKHDGIFITNTQKYGEVLEFGLFRPRNPGPSKDPRPHRKGKVWVKNGFSVQAPKGMLKVLDPELRRMLRDV